MSEPSSDEDESWDDVTLKCIKRNGPRVKSFNPLAGDIQNMTDEEWERLGRDIANNTHLQTLSLHHDALSDHKMSCLFRGLTRSSSITLMALYENQFSAAAVRSMVPFLQNANNLTYLDLDHNTILSEGFNMIFRALHDSPIKMLCCNECGIEPMEIDIEHAPRHLKELQLNRNKINTDGCRAIAKLMQGGDTNLGSLHLRDNEIDDVGVEILVNALQNNSLLKELDLKENKRISNHGNIMLLKLVNDISSIKATLRSNHTLTFLLCADDQIQKDIDIATYINKNAGSPEAAGREKVIWMQLNSERRAEFAELQGGMNHSVYSEINPLHLPEVLALVGNHHGQGDIYLALKASIADLISTVNREQCIEAQMAYHASKLEQLGAELAAIKAAKGGRAEDGEFRSSKRRRK